MEGIFHSKGGWATSHKRKSGNWEKMAISHLWKLTHGSWKERNEELHHDIHAEIA